MAINPTTLFSGLSTISDLLSNFFAVDVVGIFDGETLQQVFNDARPLKAEVKETSMVMSHPVETGVVLSDHHIINQTEINLSLIIKSEFYNSVYVQMRNSFIAADKLSVQTRTGVYNNMIIADMPHTEDTEIYDAIVMALKLREVIFIVPGSNSGTSASSNFNPVNPANQNIISAGLKYPAILSNSGITAVRSIFTGIAFKSLGRL